MIHPITASLRPTTTFLLAVSLISGSLWARQQNPKQPPPPPKMGLMEMQRLNFYLGEWDYTEEYPKTALHPGGGRNTGVYTSKPGPGGMSLINTFHSQGPMGDFQGLLVMTWDLKEKAYKEYVFSDAFSGAVVETGDFENDTLVYRFEFPAGDQTVKMRNVTRIISADKLESDQFSSIGGAPEKLVVHVVAIRRH